MLRIQTRNAACWAATAAAVVVALVAVAAVGGGISSAARSDRSFAAVAESRLASGCAIGPSGPSGARRGGRGISPTVPAILQVFSLQVVHGQP
jgi:hypothetical protein